MFVVTLTDVSTTGANSSSGSSRLAVMMSMSPQTDLLRSTLPQMIILHRLMVITLKKRWSFV